MSKRFFIVLGNGFSIDYINYLSSYEGAVFDKYIDLSNMFKHGASVPWPSTKNPGFLSFKHCPNLWTLGARPNMSENEAMSIIENIITCVNVYASNTNKKISDIDKPRNIYIRAYKELISYLKRLFVYYDEVTSSFFVNKKKLKQAHLKKWIWVKFIDYIVNKCDYKKVNIITYNYDVWLERILDKIDIRFNIIGFDYNENYKVDIYKPHGSISFKHKTVNDDEAFGIKYDSDLNDGDLDDFEVGYEDLAKNYILNAMIPPAGESSRLNDTWSRQLQMRINSLVKETTENDELIICGLSYWHVDRRELDDIFVNCNSNMNVKLINPNPSATLTAVMTSVFESLILFPSSKNLGGLIS